MFENGRILVRLLVIGCASMLLFSFPVKADDGHIRKELEGIYAKRDKALRDKNTDYIKSLETANYSEKRKDGKTLNREEADAEMYQLTQIIKEVHSFSSKVESVREGENDDEVIVDISDRGRISIVDPEGKTHEIEGGGTSRDTWVHTDKGWKIKSHQDLGSTTTMDGKPIN